MKNFLVKFATKRVIAILVTVVLVITLLALSGFSKGKTVDGSSVYSEEGKKAMEEKDESQYSSDYVTLRVDLHGWTPTTTTSSSTGVSSYNSPKIIANQFEAEMRSRLAEERGMDENDVGYPVRIEWVRDKKISVSNEQMSEYFQLQLTRKTTPTIAFTWGTNFQDAGWYVDLTEFLNEKNTYETDATLKNNEHWKDSFEDYLWQLDSIRQLDGKIAAVPITLFDGTASAIVYNSDAIYNNSSIRSLLDGNRYLGVSKQLDFADWMKIVNAASGNAATKIIDTENYPYAADSWLFQFELGPAYMSYFEDHFYGGRHISGEELLRAIIKDELNPVKQAYVRELLGNVKAYMSYLNDSSTETTTWDNGTAYAKVVGSWAYTNEKTSNPIGSKFNWEMVPSTVIDETSAYTRDFVSWEKGIASARPAADLYLNIMKAGVTNDGTLTGTINETKLRYAVEFLKYLTTKANNSTMITEMNTSLGAVKGATMPSWINTSKFKDCYFAKTTTVRGWPNGFTTSARGQMSALISKWVKGQIGDSDFYSGWDRWQKIGARAMAKSLNITL
ncbi:MAG: hypothetical protein SPL13_02475 [Clostridia bacterium]|nr:hypothetical protein [Clostridia bacterium]